MAADEAMSVIVVGGRGRRLRLGFRGRGWGRSRGGPHRAVEPIGNPLLHHLPEDLGIAAGEC